MGTQAICRRYSAALVLAMAAASAPAQACMISAPLALENITHADLVVSGQIVNYKIVLDQEVRRERKKMLARSSGMSPETRKSLKAQTDFMSDYATFDVVVDTVLVGKAAKVLTVTWDNSTFGEPETMASGRYLVALRDPSSKTPPLQGPSATFLPNKKPELLTVLQAPCAPAFIFREGDSKAKEVRKLLVKPSR